MEVSSLLARLGHFSSHLELIKDDWIFSEGLISVMNRQMVSMSVKFLMRMEELRLSMLGFTVDLSVSCNSVVFMSYVNLFKYVLPVANYHAFSVLSL